MVSGRLAEQKAVKLEKHAKLEEHARSLWGIYKQAEKKAVVSKEAWDKARGETNWAKREWAEAQIEVGKCQLAVWPERKKEAYKDQEV